MASDLATVFGLTGFIISVPSFMAADMGEQPVACAANTFVPSFLINPISLNSLNAFHTFVRSEPLAQGTTTLSGASHPSCSTISKPCVLEPSAQNGLMFILTNAHGYLLAISLQSLLTSS